jgi:hypothetical protein
MIGMSKIRGIPRNLLADLSYPLRGGKEVLLYIPFFLCEIQPRVALLYQFPQG